MLLYFEISEGKTKSNWIIIITNFPVEFSRVKFPFPLPSRCFISSVSTYITNRITSNLNLNIDNPVNIIL